MNLAWCVVLSNPSPFYVATRWCPGVGCLIAAASGHAAVDPHADRRRGAWPVRAGSIATIRASLPADSMFGGKGLSPDVLGTLTLLIAPVQVLLIIFTMYGFSQGWNVEVEAPIDQAKQRGSQSAGGPPPEPAAA